MVPHKLTAYLFVFNLFLTHWIMAILTKGCKPNNFESHDSLKLGFANIRVIWSNFVECESFLESKSPTNFALWETNLDDSIDSGNFSRRVCLSLNQKNFTTHKHCLPVHVDEGITFAQYLSLENSADSYVCFPMGLLHSVSYFYFLNKSPSSPLCTVFDVISPKIDEVLSMNPSANVFVFTRYKQVPAVIQRSKVPPLFFQYHMCWRFERRFYKQTSLIAIPSFIYFPNLGLLTRLFRQYRPNEIDKHKNKHKCHNYFFIFRRLKNNIKCYFISNTFKRNTGLRFNSK